MRELLGLGVIGFMWFAIVLSAWAYRTDTRDRDALRRLPPIDTNPTFPRAVRSADPSPTPRRRKDVA